MLLLVPEGMVLAALGGRVRVLAALGGQVWALAVLGGQVWVPVASAPVPRGLKHQESGWLGPASAGPAWGNR